jgi:plastocyanin
MTSSIGLQRARTALSPLSMAALAATLLIAATLIVDLVIIIGEFLPPLAVFAAAGLIVAAVITTGRRWAPALATVYSGLLLLAYSSFIYDELFWPSSFMFQTTMLIMLTAVVGVVAGIAATVQSYRQTADPRRLPRWFVLFVGAAAGIVVGLVGLAAVPRLGTYADINPAALAALTAITTRDNAFDDAEIHARVGETVALRFDNVGRAPHSFDIDELDVHAPIKPSGQGVAIFTPTEPGTYVFYCYLHTDPVTHHGMEGRLIVEP